MAGHRQNDTPRPPTPFRPLRRSLLIALLSLSACSPGSDPASIPPPLVLGQGYSGGIIFYLDDTGEHGLVAAPFDQGTDIPWFDGSDVTIGATGEERGAGAANTAAIVAALGAGHYAAGLCDQLDLNGYSDWFLPSRDELHLLFLNRDMVGGFTDGFYWSSTEHGEGSAWEQAFTTGAQYYASKGFPIQVRAIRAF